MSDPFGLRVVRADSVAALRDLVRECSDAGSAVYPQGGGTVGDIGVLPARDGIALDLCSLTQLIDYPARDMTITVQAGITLAELDKILAVENQRLPIDVPRADRSTLGGAIATNASGPRRYGFGTFRDYVIGISVINDRGEEVKAGGRVVKNVAGYDLCKLYIGSFGTLGIITQVTLKLKPRSEEQAIIAIGCDDPEPLLDLLAQSRTRPVCLDLLNRGAVSRINSEPAGLFPDSPWLVAVGYEDNRETVSWQVQQLIREVPTAAARYLDVRAGAAATPVWRALTDFPARDDGVLTFKANLLPHATADFCRAALTLHDGVSLQAHAGNGIVIGHILGDLTKERADAMLTTLLDTAAAAEGNMILLRCPTDWRSTLPVWGRPRGDWALMRTVKEKLDPKNIFNPGCFVDGI
jgi:glycolate oxidase FAD binding subunit